MQNNASNSTPEASSQTSTSVRKRFPWLKAIIAINIFVAIAVLFAKSGAREVTRQAVVSIEQLGGWGQVLFVAIYIIATVLLIPGSALGLGAGAVYGVVRGSVLVSIASTLGATFAFLLGRHTAREWIAKKIGRNSSFKAIDDAVAEQGWKIVFLTRLSPVFPFTVLNYAFGLTRVSLRDYVIVSWIGMMPGTVMYVYVGSLAHVGVMHRQKTPAEWALYGVGLLATIILTIFATRIARRALRKETKCSL